MSDVIIEVPAPSPLKPKRRRKARVFGRELRQNRHVAYLFRYAEHHGNSRQPCGGGYRVNRRNFGDD